MSCEHPSAGSARKSTEIRHPKSEIYLFDLSAPEPFRYGPLDPFGRVVSLDVRAIPSCGADSSRAPFSIALARFAALRSAPLKRELASDASEKSAPERLLPVKLQSLREARMKLQLDTSARWNLADSN